MQRKGILTIIFLLLFVCGYAQRPEGERPGIIKGNIQVESGEPVEYATISIYSARDSSLVTGGITKSDGHFEINGLGFGKYYIEASFVGFDITTVDDIIVKPPSGIANVGNVVIKPVAEELGEVEIVSDRPHIEYQIDKKVVNVSSDVTAIGGTAVDVLENVPSIQTDIEGNVSLRGSSDFVVYIDGRPSILDGNDALQQIPASAIDRIEIITNPSAKYEAEGTAGIINVILKKRRGQGLNGIINASIGTNNKYGTDVLLNYRANKINVYGGLDYNKREYTMEANSTETIWETDSLGDLDTTIERTKRDIERERNGVGFKLGVDYYINDKSSFGISGEYDMRYGDRIGYSYEDEYFQGVETKYYTESFSTRTSNNYELNMDYMNKFNDDGHEFTTSLNIEGETGGRDQGLEEWLISTDPRALTISYNNGDDNPEYELRYKADYVKPFSKFNKVETGVQLDVDQAHYDYYFQELDYDTDEWYDIDSLNQILDIDRVIYSAYGLYTNRFFGVDFQGGLRIEYTDRIVRADKDYRVERPDLFPSLHLSKEFNKRNQLMMGYTKRVMRPREWSLNPVRRYWDAENIRVGNPELEPEYSHLFEINYQYSISRSFVSLELYHRYSENLIQRYRETITKDLLQHTSINVGQSYSTGVELMSNLAIKRVLNINASFSVFNDKLNSPIQNENADDEQFSWRARFNTSYITPWKGRFQVNGFSRGRSITAQGEREGFFVLNMGYRQDFFDRKLTATLQARDILQTMNFSGITYHDDRIIESRFEREAPVITLTLSYKINNYKDRERERNGNGDNGGGMEGGDDGMF